MPTSHPSPTTTAWPRTLEAPQAVLAAAHRRSLQFGLDDRAQPDPDAQPRAGLAELLARNEALWTHARPVMETLREQIAGTDSMVLLTDSAGTVLHLSLIHI